MNKQLYRVLSQNLEPLVIDGGLARGLPRATADLKESLSSIYKTNDFKKVFHETERYASTIEEQWNRNYIDSVRHLGDITKLDILEIDRKIRIFISHPCLPRGRSYAEENAIAWSHPDEWKNYAVVYLWHEIMHHVTANTRSAPHLMHSLIELSCDNELRIRLNGGGKYFEEDGIPLGHKYLVDLNKKILPDWKKYLRDPNENIYQFEKRMRRKWRGEKLLKPRSRLVEWAEWH
ncbi:MAG: hypothetical protein P4L67_02655 [Candidatus Pacebacteria bacterium]|nr:hypothetical protein [Candidatus Paceibacterota bacterium]